MLLKQLELLSEQSGGALGGDLASLFNAMRDVYRVLERDSLTMGLALLLPTSLNALVCIVVHTVIYRKKLGTKRWLLLGLILISFATGLFGMILDQFSIILILHRCISIAVVFFLAIHIFVYHRKLN